MELPSMPQVDSTPTTDPSAASKARLRRVYSQLRTLSTVRGSRQRQTWQFTAAEALDLARQHVRIMDGGVQ
jgi:hypothetical protein